jgi:hypothetical protein
MKMTGFADDLTIRSMQVDDAQERRRAAFRQANSSLALDGMMADKPQLSRQEEIIQGRLVTEQAVAQCIAEYGETK